MAEQKKVRASLTPLENTGVGIFGGCLETFLQMPILTWKFCAQEGRPYPRFPGMYRGVFVQARRWRVCARRRQPPRVRRAQWRQAAAER